MKPSTINLILGVLLAAFGIYNFIKGGGAAGIIPLAVGISLIFLSRSKSRAGVLVFGHTCIVVGAFLITWGIYLLPYSEPKMAHIFGRPLFWGIFCLMGGICAIFHGFCRCITKQVNEFENVEVSKKCEHHSGSQ